MSKMKLLLDVVQDLRSLADSLQAVVGALQQDEQPEAPAPGEEENPISLETVRGFLGQKSREGYTAEVRDLLLKYGAEKLSAVDPKDYPALMKDAEVLGNGT